MSVKVSPKYQVVIPEDVRTSLNIKPGMDVNVMAKGGIIYIVPVLSLSDVRRRYKASFTKSDFKSLRDKKDKRDE